MLNLRNIFNVNFEVVFCLLASSVITGCASTNSTNQGRIVNSSAFIELKRGISLARLESTFQMKPTHEFTVRQDDETIRCVKYDLITPATYQPYYFVFTNDALMLICLPPPLEYGTRIENGNRVGFVIVQPEKTVETVIHSEDLNGEALAKSVSRVLSVKKINRWDMKVVPLVIMFAPVAVAAAPVTAVEKTQWHREFQEQRAQHDPFKVELGMTVREVEAIFGSPFTINTTADHLEIRYFGSPKFAAYSDEVWVSVVFDKGKVMRVFSDNFLDQELIRDLLHRRSVN